jgi:hypothetical protein
MNELIPFQDLQSMANVMARTKMFGKTPDELLSLMLLAQAEGIHPVRAATEYDIIQGRPALKSQAALARFQEAGGRIEWVERSDTRAEAVFSHPQSSEVRVVWDMAKAARMGYATKDNWKKQPGIMLQWRVVAEGIRICYPACLNRQYLVEEVQDFDAPREPRNVTPIVSQPITDESGNGNHLVNQSVEEDIPANRKAEYLECLNKIKSAVDFNLISKEQGKTYQKDMNAAVKGDGFGDVVACILSAIGNAEKKLAEIEKSVDEAFGIPEVTA